jgi:radical SAM superfamily enzyme YgiQ (UPF0313 family)
MHGLIFNIGIKDYNRSAGAHRIATHLRQNGWDIEVFDFVEEYSLMQLIRAYDVLSNKDTKFVGFSHVFVNWDYKLEALCQHIKHKNPNMKILSGGADITNLFSIHIDYHVFGYGEHAVTEVLKYWFSNGKKPIHKNINGVKVIDAKKEYPAAPFVEPNIIYENRDHIQEYEWLGIEFSRGCKFKCKFCNFPILGVRGDYTRSKESFLHQMRDTYERFGVKNYMVSDETFNDSVEKITKYADAVEELNFSPFFTGFIRPDLLVTRKQDKEELLRMGYLSHYYGVESFNRQSSKSVGKGIDPEKLKSGLIDAKNFFMNNGRRLYRGTIGLIIGLPYETMESLESTKKWLFENWQGQNFSSFPFDLEISVDGNKSELDETWQDAGYERFTIKEMLEMETKKILEIEKSRMVTHSLNWKNKNMTYYDAVEYSWMLNGNCVYQRTMNDWGQDYYEKKIEQRI